MTFVILGSQQFPFDRLVKKIDSLAEKGMTNGPVFIQIGPCKYEPRHCSWKRFLPFSEMRERIQKAELIVAHAGAGTTLLCLQYGKKPVLVPRRKRFKETIDGHQGIFAKKMQELGYADVAFDINELPRLMQTHSGMVLPERMPKVSSSKLTEYLKNFISS